MTSEEEQDGGDCSQGSNRWSLVECDEHGECSALDGVCVLCAAGTDDEVELMGPMIGLEQVLRGQTASFDEIKQAIVDGDG